MLHEPIIHLYSLFVNNAHKFCFLSVQSQTLFTRTTNLYMLLNHRAIKISLKKYLAVKENRAGRKRCDSEALMKVILFAFTEHGYVSVREIEKLCKTDIRFMWLLQDSPAPSHITIDNFMKDYFVKYHSKNLTRTIVA